MTGPTIDMEALMTRLNNIMVKENKILKEGESVQEALEMRVSIIIRKFGNKLQY